MTSEQPIRSSGQIYTEILSRGLTGIRGTTDLKYAQALADHLHNLPHLLQRLEHSGLHDFYWRVERRCFIDAVTPQQAQIFESLWKELEQARKIETKIL